MENEFFGKYNINKNIERHSGAMSLAKNRLIQNEEQLTFIKNMQNQELNYENKAYVVYQIICAFDLIKNTNEIDWSFINNFRIDFIREKLTLTRGQQKLLLLETKSTEPLNLFMILNVYQLIIVDYIFTKYNFNVYNSSRYLGEHIDLYEGKRGINIQEELNQFFTDPEFANNVNKIEEYMCYAIGNIYAFTRFIPESQSTNLKQMESLLSVYISNDNINTKLRKFLTILDDSQIIDIGF